jgi:hypothetical protein
MVHRGTHVVSIYDTCTNMSDNVYASELVNGFHKPTTIVNLHEVSITYKNTLPTKMMGEWNCTQYYYLLQPYEPPKAYLELCRTHREGGVHMDHKGLGKI